MIRQGLFKDIKGMMPLMKEAHDKSLWSDVPVDDKILRHTLQVVVNSREHCCFVTEIDGKIEGVMIGLTNQMYFSKKKEAVDLFVYTSDKAMGTGHLLMRRYISWAKKQAGVVKICMGTNSGIDQDKSKRLYELMGAKHIGDLFMIER